MSLIASDQCRVVIGLGVTGLSCARHLARRGLPFMVVDSRENPPGLEAFHTAFPGIPVELGPFREETLRAASELVVSPGVAVTEPAIQAAVAAGVPVVGDIELFARDVTAPVVAITGSNGKSTVTTLVGNMAARAGLGVAVGGNLGEPVLDLLAQGPHDLYVLELSSFQLETTWSLKPLVATVLNVSPDHMDRYPSLLAYHQAKHRIFRGAKQVVVNRGDALSEPLLAQDVTRWSFGLDVPDLQAFGIREHMGEVWLCRGLEPLMPVSDVGIQGRHNLENALAALALGHLAGLPMDAMLAELKAFRGLPHRCQWVGEYRGIPYFNDSKGTNVGASIAAIRGLCGESGRKLIVIAGGEGKGAEFSSFGNTLAEHARAVVLIGVAANEIEASVAGRIPVLHAGSMQDAVMQAAALAQAGDAVLLSPACASFDMFRSYAHRGDVFSECVTALKAGGQP